MMFFTDPAGIPPTPGRAPSASAAPSQSLPWRAGAPCRAAIPVCPRRSYSKKKCTTSMRDEQKITTLSPRFTDHALRLHRTQNTLSLPHHVLHRYRGQTFKRVVIPTCSFPTRPAGKSMRQNTRTCFHPIRPGGFRVCGTEYRQYRNPTCDRNMERRRIIGTLSNMTPSWRILGGRVNTQGDDWLVSSTFRDGST